MLETLVLLGFTNPTNVVGSTVGLSFRVVGNEIVMNYPLVSTLW